MLGRRRPTSARGIRRADSRKAKTEMDEVALKIQVEFEGGQRAQSTEASCAQEGKERSFLRAAEISRTQGYAAPRSSCGPQQGCRFEIASEMEDNPQRDACAIDGLARVTQPYVVHLRTQSDVRNHTDIDAAAKSKGILIGSGRSASIPSAEPGAAHQTLYEGIDVGGVAKRQARTDQERVGVQGYARRCGMINAKITSDAKPQVVEGQ